MPNAALTAAAGLGSASLVAGLTNLTRSLYVYENKALETIAVGARSLYVYENKALEAILVVARAVYLYENLGIQALPVLARALYAYEATHDGEVFPWLMRIDPVEQYRGGQIDLFGDGFGEVLEVGSGATATASSTNGANVPANVQSRTSAEWVSNDGVGAWLRLTFGAPVTLVGLSLEDRLNAANSWGVPLFRFSDAGADVVGGAVAPKQADGFSTTEYPVGAVRAYYAFPAPRTVTWVEVRVSSGGAGANRGLGEVWAWADSDQVAESSEAISNLGLAAESHFGIVAWSNRSPGLYPANSGQPITKAATATVGVAAESGVVVVRESI